MMQQWAACKKQAKNALLLFRMGDFFEAFHEDAETLAKVLGLTLTKRQDIPMAGLPVHTLESHLDKLIEQGFKVAIADQVEDPKEAKGLVRREITQILTPGTYTQSSFLKERENHYIVSLTQVGKLFGLAVLDLSTNEFLAIEFEDLHALAQEISRLAPKEILYERRLSKRHPELFHKFEQKITCTELEDWLFEHRFASKFLTRHFKITHLDGFGLKGMVAAINAAGAMLCYLQDELSTPIKQIERLLPYSTSETLNIDITSQAHLGLTQTRKGETSVLSVIDRTKTPMGGRLLRKWLRSPLLSVEKISLRQEAIREFQERSTRTLTNALEKLGDLERLMTKIASRRSPSPRDLEKLKEKLQLLPQIQRAVSTMKAQATLGAKALLVDLSPVVNLLDKTLAEEVPLRIGDPGLFAPGVHPRLDELYTLNRDGKLWLLKYQEKLRNETGIKTLKVQFNKVLGYYIEVSRNQAKNVPESFEKRQSLANSERFVTPILRDYEQKILTAADEIERLQATLFHELLEQVCEQTTKVLGASMGVTLIDVLSSLAKLALEEDYCCPLVDASRQLTIEKGRHLIVENVVGRGTFIPNDTTMSAEERMMLITGPNMGGKSTYMRQVALIVILAHMGSFVPAKRAHIGLTDQVFTRIGAHDNLANGQSTFMVEMNETSHILNTVTSRSLVILDEIGRGTSTYDGISIAWSVAEFLLLAKERKVHTLFATHYFELTALEDKIAGVVNYHVEATMTDDSISFLYKIERGAAKSSYGVQVAQLAGLPHRVVNRARTILKQLESERADEAATECFAGICSNEEQLLLF